VPFKVTVAGEDFLTDDLTLDEAIAVEKATNTSWRFIDPLRSAGDCKAIMVAFLSRTRGKDDAEKFVGALNLRTLLSSVTFVEDDRPDEFEDGLPKAAAESSTG
jgi:hypothetical protein